jgi:transcriptional regulator with XRE-family HTH domain
MLKERQREEWAARIDNLLDKAGMTHEELAAELEVSRQAVSQWVNNVFKPRPNIRKKIIALEVKKGLNGLSHAS